MARNAKMTPAQKLALLEQIEKPENRFLVTGATHPMDPDAGKRRWDEIALVLNSQIGALKTGEKWKKTFVELRCSINKKARGILVQRRMTGVGAPTGPVELTDLEERFFKLGGKIRVEGEDGLDEIGHNTDRPKETVQIPALIPATPANPAPAPWHPAPAPSHGLPLTPAPALSPIPPQTPAPIASSPVPRRVCEDTPNTSRSPKRYGRALRGATRARPYDVKTRQAKQAADVFAEAAKMQAEALKEVAAALNRQATVQEESSRRIEALLERALELWANKK